MSLRDVVLKTEYRTLKDDIAREFYIPVLKEAVTYKRAVGFFSSSILAMITDGLYELYKNNGHIMILASPKLSDDDIKAITQGYENRTAIIKNALLRELGDYEDFKTRDRLNLLACLIAEGCLDFKIVEPILNSKSGMYHEKVGIIEDLQGNVVAFSGSMNESSNALENNYESFDVFCSWENADAERVRRKEKAFTRLWDNKEDNVMTYAFPEVEEYFVRKYQRTSKPLYELMTSKDVAVGKVEEERTDYLPTDEHNQNNGFSKPAWLQLYDYQQEAIDRWRENGYRGIFDMATGTGKTLTGLSALYDLCRTKKRLAVIIVCPYQHLVDQWVDDIVKFNVKPIIGHSASPQKNYKQRLKNAVFSFNLEVQDFFCFICTNATFAAVEIQRELIKLKDSTVLLVDEAHNFGADSLKEILKNSDFTYRLALSATLDRHNDPEGTEMLYKYFGKVCISYDLGRAIEEKKLVPYHYYPVIVYLTEDELDQYNILTVQIGKGIYKKNGRLIVTQQAKTLLLKRSRLVAGAKNKISELKNLMEDNSDKHDMLIYCGATNVEDEDSSEEIRQIDYITRMLNFEYGMRVVQFTSHENEAERQNRIAAFKNREVQALVAIKCLDEGVNIPSIRTAFILASTTNPKEYVQRRGRVLRRNPGKDFADIYDFVTLPRPLDVVVNSDYELATHEMALIKNEIKRMSEFRDLSMNFYVADRIITEIREAYNLYDDIEFVDEEAEWEDNNG